MTMLGADFLLCLQALMTEAQRLGMDHAEASARLDCGFSAGARQGERESLSYHNQVGCRISVYHEYRTGSAYTTDISKQGLQNALEKAISLVSFTEPDPMSGLPELNDIAFKYPDCDLEHPWTVTPEQAMTMAIDLENQALAMDKRCFPGEGASISTYTIVRFLVNTLGFSGHYSRTSHGKSISLLAKSGDQMQSDYAYSSARSADDLSANEYLAQQVADKTLGRLGGRVISSCEVPVIFSPEMAVGFWRYIFGAISGKRLYRQKSFLCDRVGETLFRPDITLKQNPYTPRQQGSMPFDSDGSIPRELAFIEDGVFKHPMTNAYSARKLDVINTGNAGGIHHCVVPDDQISLNAMCEQMGEGLLVTDLMGQSVDLLTGDYSRGATGYWVSGGEKQYPVEGITIASTLPAMMKGIRSLGKDKDTRSSIHAGSICFDNMVIAGQNKTS